MAGDATDPLNLASFRSDRLNIVIGIDVGTTCSAVSYAFLKPDQIPEVQTVTRYAMSLPFWTSRMIILQAN